VTLCSEQYGVREDRTAAQSSPTESAGSNRTAPLSYVAPKAQAQSRDSRAADIAVARRVPSSHYKRSTSAASPSPTINATSRAYRTPMLMPGGEGGIRIRFACGMCTPAWPRAEEGAGGG